MSYINNPNNNIPINKSYNPFSLFNNDNQINNNSNNNPFNNNNLRNSNVMNPPSIFNIPNNFRQSVNNNNVSQINKNIFDYNKSYKEEKSKELLDNQKNNRFMQNYENKIKNSVNINNNINSNDNKEEVFLTEYIKKIKQIYQNRTEYDNFIADNGYFKFSHCPFCQKPSIFYLDRVQCIDNCFKTAVPSDTFSYNYTLDNFIEQYETYYFKHINCKADLITLYIDNESKTAEFLCSKCEKNIFDDD